MNCGRAQAHCGTAQDITHKITTTTTSSVKIMICCGPLLSYAVRDQPGKWIISCKKAGYHTKEIIQIIVNFLICPQRLLILNGDGGRRSRRRRRRSKSVRERDNIIMGF